MASGSDSNSVVSQALNGQKILRKASLSLSLIYNKIQTCIRCEKDLKKGEVLNGKFVFLKYIGRGSFGKVIKAKNIQTDEIVAIKMTENISPLQRHALQEIKTLTEIHTFDSNNGFIVKMLEYFNWKDSICIVFEILHQTLYQLLKETDFQGIHLSHVKVLAWQIIMALKFLSVPQLGIIHCDLKPENIMIASKQRAGVKIIDFGSSCKKIRKYRYVQSRYYRAPEVLLGLSYSSPIDMWSAGCVFAELLVGKPIFPGTTESNQLVRKYLAPHHGIPRSL